MSMFSTSSLRLTLDAVFRERGFGGSMYRNFMKAIK
jgi:hypothetical protein